MGWRSRITLAFPLVLAVAACRRDARESRERVPSAVADARTAAAPPDAGLEGGATHPRPGWTERIRVLHAPFPAHPDVIVHASGSFDPHRPLRVVVFLHGWFGCVEVIAGGTDAPCTEGGPVRFAMDVQAQFDRAAVDALLVIPQLAFDVANSSPGRLGESGGLRDLLGDVLADPAVARHLDHGGDAAVGRITRVVLVAHSGAYVPAAFALAQGGIDVQEVHMLDALYHPRPELERWFRAHATDFATGHPPRRLTFVYTDREGTGPVTHATVDALETPATPWRRHRALTPPPDDLLAAPLFVLRTAVVHEAVPRAFLAPILEASAGLHD